MWDNFARLTALLAKVRVWFNNLTIYLNFSAIFSQIAPSKPLNQGRQVDWGRLFAAEGRHFNEASNVTPLIDRWWFTQITVSVFLSTSVWTCMVTGSYNVSFLAHPFHLKRMRRIPLIVGREWQSPRGAG